MEPVDFFYPLSVTSRAAGSMNGKINGKETYRRVLIRRKEERIDEDNFTYRLDGR